MTKSRLSAFIRMSNTRRDPTPKTPRLVMPAPEHLLIDWMRLPQVAIPQSAQAKADRTMASVAAASILAKVHRDQLMVAYDGCYPVYGFGAHKGLSLIHI